MKISRFVLFSWIGLAMVLPSLQGLVLCIDGHGHVAIEAEHSGCCQDHDQTDSTASKMASSLVPVADSHDCNDCIDLPLSTDNTSLLLKNIDLNSLTKIKLAKAVNELYSNINSHASQMGHYAQGYEQPPGCSAWLAMHNITVLRV